MLVSSLPGQDMGLSMPPRFSDTERLDGVYCFDRCGEAVQDRVKGFDCGEKATRDGGKLFCINLRSFSNLKSNHEL